MYKFVFKNVQKKDQTKIGDSIILRLYEKDIIAKYHTFGNCLFLESSKDISNELKNSQTFRALLVSSNVNDIFNSIKELIIQLKEPKSFAIKVNRKGDHPYTSTELARNVASAVFEKWPDIKVNLKKPILEINVEIINNRCIVYC